MGVFWDSNTLMTVKSLWKCLFIFFKKVKYSYCQYTIKHERYFPRSTGAWAGSQICTCSKRKFKTLSLSSHNDIKAPFVTRIKACSNQEQSESEFAWFSNSFCKHFVNIHLSAFSLCLQMQSPSLLIDWNLSDLPLASTHLIELCKVKWWLDLMGLTALCFLNE